MRFMATGLILGRFDCLLTRAVTFVPRREIQLEKIFLGLVQGRYLHIFLVFMNVDIHSSHERKSKLLGGLGFWFPRSELWIPGTGSQSLSVKLGFWMSFVTGIPDSLNFTPDSRAQDSRFLKQNFPGFRIPQNKNFSHFGIRIPYTMGRSHLIHLDE